MSNVATITLSKGETKEVALPKSENVKNYRFRVEQGKVRFGHSRQDTSTGDVGVPGDRGKITPETGDTIWIRNVGLNDAKIELTPRGLEIEFFPNSKIQVTDKVFPGIDTDQISSGSAGQTLQFKDQSIPEGGSLSIQCDSGNTSPIYVGGDSSTGFKIEPGSSLSVPVDNMNAVDVYFPSSGDTAYAEAEVDQ